MGLTEAQLVPVSPGVGPARSVPQAPVPAQLVLMLQVSAVLVSQVLCMLALLPEQSQLSDRRGTMVLCLSECCVFQGSGLHM